jgi:hypothetical protein
VTIGTITQSGDGGNLFGEMENIGLRPKKA